MAVCFAGSSNPPPSPEAGPPPMRFDNEQRPAWLNWLFLGIFLWSSWQLAGFWFQQLHR